MKTYFDKPKIISQHVDTLVTSHKMASYDCMRRFGQTLDILYKYKLEAQAIEGVNQSSRFTIAELFGFGKFKVFAQGVGVYRYRIENEDFSVMIGDIKFDSDRPQIIVKYYQSFLVAIGHVRAYELVKKFINAIMGDSKDLVTEIHLATDVWGIRYDKFDSSRIQTNFKISEYGKNYPDLDDLNVQTVCRRRLETITIGKNEYMFRIYDKLQELSRKPADLHIIETRWILGGYDKSLKIPVWRHEIQLRGSRLKNRLPRNSKNQVQDAFNMLGNLWAFALSKIEYTPLNMDEIARVNDSDKADTIKKIFKRAKEQNRPNPFEILNTWRNEFAEISLDYSVIKEAGMKNAERACKAFVASAYKACGCDISAIPRVIEEISKKLYQFEGLTLHGYGASKIIGSFIKNERFINQTDCVIPDFHIDDRNKSSEAYFEILRLIGDKEKSPLMKKFEGVMEQRGDGRLLTLPNGNKIIASDNKTNAPLINNNASLDEAKSATTNKSSIIGREYDYDDEIPF